MAFCSMDNKSFLKFPLGKENCLRKRNFAQQFIWGAKFCATSFVGEEIKLNVDETNESCA